MSIRSVKLTPTEKEDIARLESSGGRVGEIIKKIVDITDDNIEKIYIGGKHFNYLKINLREMDVETMYPVVFKYGLGIAAGMPVSDIRVGRDYYIDSDLNYDEDGNRINSSDRFSDGYPTPYHVNSFTLRLVGGDTPWGGARPHGHKVMYYSYRYMPAIQLFEDFRLKVWLQGVDDTVFTSDTSDKPTVGSIPFTGLYLRGGLSYYVLYNDGFALPPKVYTEPKLLFRNTSNNNTEWVAPFDYKIENNPAIVSDIGGLK